MDRGNSWELILDPNLNGLLVEQDPSFNLGAGNTNWIRPNLVRELCSRTEKRTETSTSRSINRYLDELWWCVPRLNCQPLEQGPTNLVMWFKTSIFSLQQWKRQIDKLRHMHKVDHTQNCVLARCFAAIHHLYTNRYHLDMICDKYLHYLIVLICRFVVELIKIIHQKALASYFSE